MDRPARLLGWLLPPLLGIALGTAAWLALRAAGALDPPAPPPSADYPKSAPWYASRATPPEAQAPRPLPAGQSAQRLAPLRAHARDVTAAEFLAIENEQVAGFPWLDEKDAATEPDGARSECPPAPPAPLTAEPPEKHLPGASPATQAGPSEAGQARPARVPVAAVLSPPTAAKERSLQLEQIARQADRHTHEGFALAERGAYFAARDEFTKALGLIAEGLDAELHTHAHVRALNAGLTAVREAGDFPAAGTAARTGPDLARIAAGHRTPIFKDADLSGLTPPAATQSYLGFAQEQLGAAAGEELAGSMALYALGKLHAALAARGGSAIPAAGPKAVTFFQAALLVSPRNHLASNDLGVLLAQGGHYRDAYRALTHSLSIHRQSTGWHNLAVVLSHLGDADRARRAEQLAALARQQETDRRRQQTGSAGDLVRWLDPATFAGTSTVPGGPGQAPPSAALRHAAAAPEHRPMPAAAEPSPQPQPAGAMPPRVVRQPSEEAKSSTTGWRWPWQRDRQTQ